MNNSRYTVALHILTYLAMNSDHAVTSDCIALSVNTHPVVIRNILASLRKGDLVLSQSGVGGGIKLNRPANKITLLDVYQLFQDAELFPLHPNQPKEDCPCGGTIQDVLSPIYAQAESATQAILSQSSIADLAAQSWSLYQERNLSSG